MNEKTNHYLCALLNKGNQHLNISTYTSSIKMNKKLLGFVLLAGITISLCSCKSKSQVQSTAMDIKHFSKPTTPNLYIGPRAVIYKTTKDYSDFVPVIMNDDRTKIVSYPAPTDVYYKGVLAKPTPLKDGYWLDNRGISKNVVFTSYTYEEYSKLKEVPSMKELMSKIIDTHPLVALYHCNERRLYTDEVNDLNKVIDSGFVGAIKDK